ncbi:MAG: aldo/keto reductase, partial [Atopobiaceae bacterium]|nr:aldo/keto reductase [Atopobiaceae bacterium]
WALEAGYRHIDTAMVYGNEESVREGIAQSGVPREEIFITTKMWNTDIYHGNFEAALETSLETLGTDYIDLYLLNWPVKGRVEAWKALERFYEQGKCRAIGVSNFEPHHLEELFEAGSIVPAVNQIESNPQFHNQEVVDYCFEKGIKIEAWSPLGGSPKPAGPMGPAYVNNILTDPKLAEIAAGYGKSVAQLIIRWHIQRGIIVLPKSTHKERIESNLDVFDFELSADDMAAINALATGMRTGGEPDVMAEREW